MTNVRYAKMMINKNVLYPTFLVFLAFSLEAATYYVSTTGNNTTGNGSIGSPWKTITKSQSMLSPGDTLLVRAGSYYESVTLTTQGTEGNPVTIKAYPGETPVLDGRIIITGWTKCAADEPGLTVAGRTNLNATSIYKAQVDTSQFIGTGLWWLLFEDGIHSLLNRWPDQSEGYGLDPTEFQQVPTESIGTSASVKDNTFLNPSNPNSVWYPYINGLTSQQLASYWNDSYAQVWFKSGANATGSYSITGYANNEITTGTLRRALLSGDRYSIYRHPHLVNAPGKFYFSPQAVNGYQTLYYWPKNVANLNGKISIPSQSKGFYASNKNYIIIDGFKIAGFKEMGIHFINPTSINPVIKNCIVEDCGNTGIYIQNATQVVIDNCTVNRVGDRGIFINGGVNCVIKNSSAKDNRGTCFSMYNVDNGQIIDNNIYKARGVHVNGVSCYLGCKKILIARNKFDPGVNLAFQNISDVCIFANIMDGAGEKTNLLSTWVDTTNSNYATRGYQVYLQNTLINAASPYSMIDFLNRSGSFTDATITNNGGKVQLNAAGRFTSTQFKYTGTYGLMIYCEFSDSTYADGWYESIANTADTCTINLAYVSGTPKVSGQCGGQSDNYLHNNLIGGSARWQTNMLGRSHNWWIPKTYGSTFSTPNPPLPGEIYTYYTDRISAMNACFTDWANQNYTLKTGSAAIGAGMSLTAINAILDNATMGESRTSIRQNFPDFDFTKDISGKPWASTPSMGAYEFASDGSTPTYTLTTTAANGTIVKSPDKTAYTAGETVTLTATANTGYTFTGWSGDASGTAASVTITLNGNKSVTANFTQTTLGHIIDNRDPQTALVGAWPVSGALNPYGADSVYARNPDLSFSWLFTPSESGTYEVSMWWTEFSSRSSTAPVEIQHASGTAFMTVNQLTNGGIWNFLGQYSFNAGTTYRVTIRTLTDNSSISADAVRFVKTQASEAYTLTTTAANGTVVKSPDKTAYTAGETVTLTATANPGYTFTGWSGDASGTAASVTITMNSNKSVTATCTQNSYTLTTVAVNGTVTKSPDKSTYTYGETVTLSATPSVGYNFDSWTGSVMETTNPVAITMDNNKSVTANFTPLPTALEIREGLVGEWMFSENTGPVTWDSSLNANCAFLSDESMWKQPGNLDFESPQTYLMCPPEESLNLTGSLTISAWINPRSYGQSSYGRIVDKGDGAGNRGFSLMVNGNSQNFGYLTYGGDYVSSNESVISLNTWTHVCAAYDEQKKTITFFVNGQDAGTSSYTRSPAATDNDPLYIGLRGYDRLRNFDGIIDGVCLYSRSLNITEVQQLYAAGKEGRLVGLWLMDDYRGSEASDRSGYDNTAILQNNPEWGFGWAGEDFIRLNGTNQAALIDCTALQTQTGTIAMLVQPETSEGLQFLFGHTLANTNYIYLYTMTGKLALGLGNSTVTATDIAVLEPGVMYHVALTWNGTIYAVYVDGKQKAAGIFSGLTAIAPVADIANMGTPEYREQNMGLNGIIDDVQIFSQALSAKEVDALSKTWRTKQNRSFAFCVPENIPDNPASYTAANLPAGATFDVTTQTLTWTPWYNQAGDHQIIFVPQDQSDPLKVIVSVHNVKLKDWYQEFLLRAGKL